MSAEKAKRNEESLKRLDEYLEKVSPDELFRELEGRCPDGQTLEAFFGQSDEST